MPRDPSCDDGGTDPRRSAGDDGYVPPYVHHPDRGASGPVTARPRTSGTHYRFVDGGQVLGAGTSCGKVRIVWEKPDPPTPA